MMKTSGIVNHIIGFGLKVKVENIAALKINLHIAGLRTFNSPLHGLRRNVDSIHSTALLSHKDGISASATT
ncbi:hypothetical protein D3C81_2255260 [compost metagenome]